MKIDVSKCEFITRYDDCNLYEDSCKYITDCHYKQLLQLKAENEELRKQLMQKDEVNTFFNSLDWNNDPCKICPKKNCLDEIEYFINKIDTTMGCTYGDYDCESCSDTGDTICSFKLKNLILQKIKEVKEK